MRKIGYDNVVIPIGGNIANFNGIIKLNKSALFLWNKVKDGISRDDLVDSLMKEYNIDENLAISDVDKFIRTLNENSMLEDH
ncbi:MAG: PqqD family protein [Intestinibacter sp.]